MGGNPVASKAVRMCYDAADMAADMAYQQPYTCWFMERSARQEHPVPLRR